MKNIIVVFLLAPLALFAQIKFKHISVNEGLSQSAVHSFAQDNRGYLWVATRDGLNRYDGSEFTIFRHSDLDSSSIANNRVWSVSADPSNGVWAATSSGLSYYDPVTEEFSNFFPQGFNNLEGSFPRTREISFIGNDSIFLSTERGIFIYNRNENLWTKRPLFEGQQSFFSVQLHSNDILIGVDSGLFKISRERVFQILEQTLSKCRAYYQDERYHYVGTERGLFILDSAFNQEHFIPLSKRPSPFGMAITKDTEGRLWVGNNGITLLDANFEKVAFLNANKFDDTALSNDRTTDVYKTDDGTIWVGTNGFGINKYNKYQASITTISHNPFNSNSLSDWYSVGLYAKGDTLYAGSSGAVDVFDVSVYPPVKMELIDLAPFNTGRVYTILPLNNGNLLLGTERGLIEMGEKMQMRVPNLRIFDLALLPNENVLIATANGNEGLVWYNIYTHEYKRLEVLPPDLPLRCISVEEDGVWVGSDNGLFQIPFSLDSYRKFEKEGVAYPTQVKCVFRDSKGILWVGTWAKGLHVFNEDTDSFEPFDKNDELPNQTIYGILEDSLGNLWMSSNNGIFCYKRSDGSNEIIRFSAEQGLQSNEFNTGAYGKADDGTMFFGGINGLSYFEPELLLSVPSQSRLFITNVWVNQEKIPVSRWVDNKLTLHPSEQNLRFDFTTISFNSATEIKYRYKLNGKEFINNGQVKTIHLSNLRPGQYQLQLNSTDSYGRWNESTSTFQFEILIPFFKKIWFQVIVVLGIIIIGFIINILRTLNLKIKNDKLALAVKERTWEVTEKNNEILAQNEELSAQSDVLSDQNEQLEAQQQELLLLKESLERRVEKRTEDLNKKNVELKEQYTQMEQFSYITSHNLKGPIASLKGLLSLLPTLENANDAEIIDRIKQSVLKLDSIITDLGSIMELQKNKENLKNINLTQTMELVVRDLQEFSKEKNVQIIVEECGEVLVEGIKAYLYSIMYNLINNSIKYNRVDVDSYVRISCRKEAENVIIAIKDNGIGINMKYAKDKVFKLFQRFNDLYEGEGIGLYMTKIQVEIMKGDIHLNSVEGQGTTVTIVFPLVSAE